MELKDLTAYKIANELSFLIYEKVTKWDWFNKRTMGIQTVDSVDSIGANIAEGYGRYHKKEKIKFYFNARGSVFEVKYWSEKARERKLFSEEDYNDIESLLQKLPREINNLIKLTFNNLKR